MPAPWRPTAPDANAQVRTDERDAAGAVGRGDAVPAPVAGRRHGVWRQPDDGSCQRQRVGDTRFGGRRRPAPPEPTWPGWSLALSRKLIWEYRRGSRRSGLPGRGWEASGPARGGRLCRAQGDGGDQLANSEHRGPGTGIVPTAPALHRGQAWKKHFAGARSPPALRSGWICPSSPSRRGHRPHPRRCPGVLQGPQSRCAEPYFDA